MRSLISIAFAVLCLSLAAHPANAMHKLSKNWSVTEGIGLLHRPEYEGSRDSELVPMPLFDISWRNRLFLNAREGLGANLLVGRNYKAGIRATLDFGRDEDESSDLRGMGNIDAGVELGAYAEYFFDYFRFHGSIRQGVVTGHESLLVDFGIQLGMRLKRTRTVVLLGPSVTWASRDYMATYFGIDASQSARSGLAHFAPDAGLKNLTLGIEINQPLWKRVSMVGLLEFKRLLGDAADSPLVKKDSQFRAGLGISYQF